MNFRGGYTFEDNSVDDVPNPFENFNDPGYRKRQYSNAYGDYQGGYGPSNRANLSKIFQGPGPQRNQRPPAIWGRGFGPDGPPFGTSRSIEDRAVKYLVRCGLPINSVKKLPKELLRMMEPQFCGLCGQNFESFEISRTHYLSKKHMKNKAKWLSQRAGTTQQGFTEFFEAPFRSRDLYCELCDVQITSKVHADSHYSGKSHRSIVEGRKNPKNPELLRPSMQRRVVGLIRREKRCLKLNASEAPAEPQKEPAKIQPDLYCEICKTSVTCTEQMTAHLNGKRHLTKEKQYILKTMRGESTPQTEVDADNQDEGNGDVDQDEGNDEAEAEGAENGSKEEKAGDNAENEEWGDEWD